MTTAELQLFAELDRAIYGADDEYEAEDVPPREMPTVRPGAKER
jgi:hypothetical protein